MNEFKLGKGQKAQCQRCQRLIPATNIRALMSAARRHKDKYHKGETGDIHYKAPK